MLVNLLENQSKDTQINFDSSVKSNFQSSKNNFFFIELLGNSQSIEKSSFENKDKNSPTSHKDFLEKNRSQSQQEKYQKINTPSLKKNQTDDNKTTLNPLKKEEKQQLKENTEPDEKKIEKKKDIDIIEENQEEKKKIKKKKTIELSFLEIENFKKEKKERYQKKQKKVIF